VSASDVRRPEVHPPAVDVELPLRRRPGGAPELVARRAKAGTTARRVTGGRCRRCCAPRAPRESGIAVLPDRRALSPREESLMVPMASPRPQRLLPHAAARTSAAAVDAARRRPPSCAPPPCDTAPADLHALRLRGLRARRGDPPAAPGGRGAPRFAEGLRAPPAPAGEPAERGGQGGDPRPALAGDVRLREQPLDAGHGAAAGPRRRRARAPPRPHRARFGYAFSGEATEAGAVVPSPGWPCGWYWARGRSPRPGRQRPRTDPAAVVWIDSRARRAGTR